MAAEQERTTHAAQRSSEPPPTFRPSAALCILGSTARRRLMCGLQSAQHSELTCPRHRKEQLCFLYTGPVIWILWNFLDCLLKLKNIKLKKSCHEGSADPAAMLRWCLMEAFNGYGYCITFATAIPKDTTMNWNHLYLPQLLYFQSVLDQVHSMNCF